MTMFAQRPAWFKTLALSVLSVAALTACGEKEAAAPAAPKAEEAASAAAAGPLQIGFMYVSPIGDGGWTYQHELGR
ncbi:Uncharacterised protein [uncultured Comamonas sp.]|nr:Uncharacterised protein [uncultured Comamonas sp.]